MEKLALTFHTTSLESPRPGHRHLSRIFKNTSGKRGSSVWLEVSHDLRIKSTFTLTFLCKASQVRSISRLPQSPRMHFRHVFWDPRRSFSSCMDMESLFGDQGENDASLHPEVPKQTRGSESGDSFAVRFSFGDPPASIIREEIHGSSLQAGIYRLQDLFTHR